MSSFTFYNLTFGAKLFDPSRTRSEPVPEKTLAKAGLRACRTRVLIYGRRLTKRTLHFTILLQFEAIYEQ